MHAVFNSLIMNIQLNDLLESKLDKIESDLQNKLLKKGILITDDLSDKNAYNLLYNYYIKQLKKSIQFI